MTERISRPYRRLASQMLMVLLAFGLVPLVVMGIAGFAAQLNAVETRTRNVLEAMVKNRRATVELFLEEKRRQLELVAAAAPVSELGKPAVIEMLRDQLRSEHGAIVDLGLIDDTGRHVVYVGPYSLQDLNYSDQPWFEQVMVRGHYESDIFMGFRRFPHMVMAVKKREQGRVWILRATIDTDQLSDLVREGGLESGADVFVLNRAGEYQTRYSAEHRLMERADLPVPPLHSGVRVIDYAKHGAREFVATAWLRNDNWVLVARQRVPGFLALVVSSPIVTIVFVAGLLLVPPLSLFVARRRLSQIRGLERERAELYQSVAQSEKMATIGRMAASIAHEINNPFAIIQEQVGVLTDGLADAGGVPDAELRDRLRKIEAQIQRGRGVTHRLLGFSRRLGPGVEPIDVAEALNETLNFLAKEAEASNIQIVRDYDKDAPLIRSSVAQMQQVFLNLINNAIDAVGRDGEIRLSVRRDGDGVAVAVADNGPGIPAALRDRVFDPFFSTKTGPTHNAGLGLAICRETMLALGGRIEIDSRIERGTRFIVWFPTIPPGETNRLARAHA
ncbi:MAG: ATP-binding protein [Acidobacteriota bacterium]